MKVVFETEAYGRIEVTRANLTGDCSGRVYFQRQDYETHVNPDGTFFDQWETPFQVAWPTRASKWNDAILSVTTPRTIGRSAVTRPEVPCV